MPILQYETRVAADGYIVLPPEYRGRHVAVRVEDIEDNDDWPTPTDEQLDKMYTLRRGVPKTPEQDFLEFAGCPKDMPGKELISKKQIRSARLEERYGDQTEEQRKEAGRKFFETWNGLLEGIPDMTAKEIRAERLEKRYGQ
ncbi:MAG: hypothetical protein FWC43_08510 [Planctomycetaceae bacterium]|nr:hypothetical protein [Planctomycetaceae bacterium]